MENSIRSVESIESDIVQEEGAASALLHPCSTEEEAFSTVPGELEEQMAGLNLNNNILPSQSQNRNREGSLQQQQPQHHDHFHPHHGRLHRHLHQIRNTNINRNRQQQRQQQMRIVNININRQSLEEQLQHLRIDPGSFMHQYITNSIQRRSHLCPLRLLPLQHRRSIPVCEEVPTDHHTTTIDLNRPAEDDLKSTPMATATTSSVSAATACEYQSETQLDRVLRSELESDRNGFDTDPQPDFMLG